VAVQEGYTPTQRIVLNAWLVLLLAAIHAHLQVFALHASQPTTSPTRPALLAQRLTVTVSLAMNSLAFSASQDLSKILKILVLRLETAQQAVCLAPTALVLNAVSPITSIAMVFALRNALMDPSRMLAAPALLGFT
jgi:hypothetical protein